MGQREPGRIRPLFGGRRRARTAIDPEATAADRPSQVAPTADEVVVRPRDVELLLQSPLFDTEWYALVAGLGGGVAGAAGDRETLVRHYLSRPVEERVSPQPLFDADWFRSSFSGEVGARDPFLVYLRRQAWSSPTHPLFSATYYRRTVPAAKKHPHGPIAHYVEEGAPSGAPAHRWLQGDGSTPAIDVRAFVLDRHREWLRRRSTQHSGGSDQGPVIGAGTDAAIDPGVDWEAEHERDRDPALTSVIIDSRSEWETTARAVRRALDHGGEGALQVIVVAHGADALTSVMLDALTVRHPEVAVLHETSGVGGGGAVSKVRGARLLLLDPDVELDPGWLAPLAAGLADPTVRGVQPLLLHPDRTVRCAGVAFAADGGAQEFLDGFPAEDAEGIETLSFQALSGAALLVRTADFIAARGYDDSVTPQRRGIDLCLRLAAPKPGRFVVRPDATAVQHAAGSPGGAAADRAERVERADHVELWRSRGFEVAPDAGAPGPRLVRTRLRVSEGDPRLRWAIKNPATPGPYGDRWGDTHFAAALAAALRDLGQEVVIDRREAFHRPSAHHDDVNLVLRGLTPFRAEPDAVGGVGTVTLGWVISHPDEVTPEEVATWDRTLAASVHWARRKSQEWGIEIEALLQATDPSRFHPDLADPDTGHRVLFVGSSRKQYRPMVRNAVEHGLPLSVYGTEWEGILPPEFLRATYLPNDQVGAAYAAAGVVLNDHWEDMRLEGFLSNRLFDAVASGARVISDDVSGLDDGGGLFGRSVQVARTATDLVELWGAADLDALFGDAAERRVEAERVRREHSFTARARRLLDVAIAARSARGLRN